MFPPIIRGFDKSFARVESDIKGVVNNTPKLFVYGDTACYIDKVIELTWGDIYSNFSRKYIPQDEEEFKVYINVMKSWLHKTVTHPLVFLCAETIERILQQIDEEQCVIKSDKGELVESCTVAYIAN